MDKSVLISIKPKWCATILNGKKTVEVRKTRPKLEPPFKCYIYCTNSGGSLVYGDKPCADGWSEGYTVTYGYSRREAEEIWDVMNGKVVGEFICDRIDTIKGAGNSFTVEGGSEADTNRVARASCLSFTDMRDYCGVEGICYAWHISKLKIYDQPRPLTNFHRPCPNGLYCEGCAMYMQRQHVCGNSALQIRRPPQSWMYVEAME